jgi:hypothetical protein
MKILKFPNLQLKDSVPGFKEQSLAKSIASLIWSCMSRSLKRKADKLKFNGQEKDSTTQNSKTSFTSLA